MPSLPPRITTELFLNGNWTNKSGDRRDTSNLNIVRGLASESNDANPMAASCTFDNRSGDYSPRNPNSALYGDLNDRNTPIRFSVDAGGAWVNIASGAAATSALAAPYNALMDVTDDIDLRFEIAADTWWDNSIFGTIIAQRWDDTGNQRSWKFGRDENGFLSFSWSEGGTLASVRTAISTDVLSLYDGQRICLRVTLETSINSSSHAVKFYYSQTMSGGWKQLGDDVDLGGGVTALFNGTAGIWLGAFEDGDLPGSGAAFFSGDIYGFELHSVAAGPKRIGFNISDLAEVGDTSFVSDGITWSLQADATFTNTHRRMHGEVPAWPIGRDRSGNDKYSEIEPAGIMRRLDAGKKPQDSAIRRYIASSDALECWPCTDGANSIDVASMITGRKMLYFDFNDTAAKPQPADGRIGDWNEPVMQVVADTNIQFDGYVPITTDTTNNGWAFDWCRSERGLINDVLLLDNGAATDADNRLEISILVRSGPNDALITRVSRGETSSSSAFLAQPTGLNIFDNLPHHLRFEVVHGVGDFDWFFYVDGSLRASGTVALEIGPMAKVEFSGSGFSDLKEDMSFGYLTYWDSNAPAASEVYSALLGFPGETSIERFERVCNEQGIVAGGYGVIGDEQRLGFQDREKLIDTLNSSAAPNFGYVLESRKSNALVYRSGTTLFNQEPMLTLDFTNGLISDPFKPLDDDRLTKNDITVTRKGGSFGTAILQTGRMSVQDPEDGGAGRYDEAEDRSLFTDDQAFDQAGWMLQLGTFDGLRYPKIILNIANERVYAMINDIYKVDVGDMIRLINLPDDHGPDAVDLIVQGYEEVVGASEWSITFSCRPGKPWNGVATADGSNIVGNEMNDQELTYIDVDHDDETSACTLATAIDSDDILINVETDAASEEWTTDQDEYPFSLEMAGERLRALGYGEVMNDNPYLLEGTTGYFVTVATMEHRPDVQDVVHGGKAALKITPNGSSASAGVFSNASAVGTVDPGKTYTASVWHMMTFNNVLKPAFVALYWYDSSSAFISANFSSGVFATAGSWTKLSVSAAAPANASRVQIECRLDSTPAVTDIAYWSAPKIVREEAPDILDTFTRADDVNSPGTADTGQVWVESLNQWGISSNQLYAINSSNSQVTIPGRADFRELAVTPTVWGGTTEAYLLFRFTDTSNRIRVGCNMGSVLQLQVVTGGSVVRTVLSSMIPAAGDRLSVRALGPWITAFINGQMAIMAYETAHMSATAVGVQTASTTVRFDNFSCRWTQQLTVDRSVNGIVKAQTSGTEIDLFTKPVVAL